MKLGNKGVTIVEAAVAMALIVIITLIATQISVSALATSSNSTMEFKAINITSDLVTLYRTTDSQEEFKSMIEEVYETDINTSNQYDFSFTKERMVYSITYYEFMLQVKVTKVEKKDIVYEYRYNLRG